MAPIKLGKVQMQIMRVLWSLGKATAREITDTLNEETPIAHSTVQTLLRGLMDKGAVTHQTQGRTFVFRPAIAEEKVRQSATRDLLAGVFDGNAGDLVSYLLKNEKVSRKELNEIKKWIDQQTQKKK